MKTFICLDCGTYFCGTQEESVEKGWLECVGEEFRCAFCPRCQKEAHERIANQKETWNGNTGDEFSTTRFYDKHVQAIP